jgi:hypothetical protein
MRWPSSWGYNWAWAVPGGNQYRNLALKVGCLTNRYNKLCSLVPRDSDPRKTALAKTSNNWNSRPDLSSERAPHIYKPAIVWQQQKSALGPQMGLISADRSSVVTQLFDLELRLSRLRVAVVRSEKLLVFLVSRAFYVFCAYRILRLIPETARRRSDFKVGGGPRYAFSTRSCPFTPLKVKKK